MIFTATKLPGVFLIEPEPRRDDRGHFARVWCAREFAERGLETRTAQANSAFSPRRGALRGLHYQLPPHAEVKLIRCTRGAVYDVIVDLRPDSPTHGQWISAQLTAENGCMLYAPEGCAHGYQTIVDNSELWYQASEFYAPADARGVRFDDPAFKISWPLPITAMSAADRSWPDYEAARMTAVVE